MYTAAMAFAKKWLVPLRKFVRRNAVYALPGKITDNTFGLL
jgi:hypothetical protein